MSADLERLRTEYPIRLMREASVMRAARYQYEQAAETHRKRETRHLLSARNATDPVKRAEFERHADMRARAERILLRAWHAEMNDPEVAA